MENRKLRMGMIGGGSDAFIGAIHRRAALMEKEIELVCTAFLPILIMLTRGSLEEQMDSQHLHSMQSIILRSFSA